jgi:hypothetical protein
MYLVIDLKKKEAITISGRRYLEILKLIVISIFIFKGVHKVSKC